MSRFFSIFLFTVFFIITTDSYAFVQKKAYIFSLNDFHGFVLETKHNPGAAKLATMIEKEKLTLHADDDNSIIVFSGDNYYGQGISNENYGKLVSAFAKKIGIKISAIGNHEFDWHKNLFHKWHSDSGMIFLNGNISDTQKKLTSLPKYKIITLNGIRICFIGLTTMETLTALPQHKISHIKIEQPNLALNKIVADVKKNENVDLIIGLTHIPANQEEKDGKFIYGSELTSILSVEGVDAFITAHSHETISDENDGRPIIQAKCYGKYFGILEITEIAPHQFTIKPRLVDVASNAKNLKPHPEVDEIIKHAEVTYNAKFGKIIAEAKNNAPVPRSIEGIDPLVTFIGKNMTAEFSLDGIMINAGAIRETIQKGPVKFSDILAVMPFDDEFLFGKIKGYDLKNLILNGAKGYDDKGILQFYGFNLDICHNEHAISLSSNNQPIEDNKIYKIAVTSHMYPRIDNLDLEHLFDRVNSGVIVREYIASLFKKYQIITFETPQNYLKCGKVIKNL